MQTVHRDRLIDLSRPPILRVASAALLCVALGAGASLALRYVQQAGVGGSKALLVMGLATLSIALLAGVLTWALLCRKPAGAVLAQQLLEQLQATLDLAPVGIVFTRKHRFEMVSEHFAQMLGREVQTLRGMPTVICYATPQDMEDLVERARAVFVGGGSFDGHARMARVDGAIFWARLRGRAVVPGHMDAGTLWIIEDVTRDLEQHQSLSWAANHDPLTGLSNRAVFDLQLRRAHEQAHQQPFCALFIDLDRFKQVNDSGGHAAGDKLLTHLSLVLLTHVRQNDLVARLGGDEFAVLLRQCPLPRALKIAEAIRSEIDGYRLEWEGLLLGVAASIGIVRDDGRFDSAERLLRAADAACYAAKAGGRNRVVVSEEGAESA